MVDIEKILRNPLLLILQGNSADSIRTVIQAIKTSFIAAGDEKNANSCAIKEYIFEIQCNYRQVFDFFRELEYYKAWCLLEKIEIEIKWLMRHYEPVEDLYYIFFIKNTITRLQQLFPYKLFGSSEYIKKEVRCSICNEIITLRRRCSHKKGNLYMGQRCVHNITQADLLGMALVENPFNKYSVIGVTGKEDDKFKYPEIEFLMSIIDHPFNEWHYERYYISELHSKFKEGRNDPCPCGANKKYKNCCLKQKGVKVIHTQFYLDGETINSRNLSPTSREKDI